MYRLISGYWTNTHTLRLNLYRGYQQAIGAEDRVHLALPHMPVTTRNTPGQLETRHAVLTLRLLWKS